MNVQEIPKLEIFRDHLSGHGFRVLETLSNRAPTSLFLPLQLYIALPYKAEVGVPLWIYLTESFLTSYEKDAAKVKNIDSITSLYLVVKAFITALKKLGNPIATKGENSSMVLNEFCKSKAMGDDSTEQPIIHEIRKITKTHVITYVPFSNDELQSVSAALIPEPIMNQLIRFNIDVYTDRGSTPKREQVEIAHG